MSTTIPTTLTVINEVDTRGIALVNLIKKYVTIQGYYGFKSIGANDIAFPCFMIDPTEENLQMVCLGKYRLKISYNIYWYCQESNPEAIVSQVTDIGEILAKLLSNNALGDGTPSFKQYVNPGGGYYWLTSEMGKITYSTSYINATPDSQQSYMRAGLMRFDIEDQILK